MTPDVQLLDRPLSIDACYRHVQDPACGGIVLFVGAVRNHNKGRAVTGLDFESYGPMALRELDRIARAAADEHDLRRVSVHHRTGSLGVGEVAVIIAVAAPHRAAAFAGCERIIDELKQHVPIWKKEFLDDGSYWVGARP